MNCGQGKSYKYFSSFIVEFEDAAEWRRDLLGTHYTDLYRREKHDSPEAARISMIRRIKAALFDHPQNRYVLDIASGPQSLERQLSKSFPPHEQTYFEGTRFVTVDYAIIAQCKLLGSRLKNITHIRCDAARSLPFKSDSFGLVVSNMGIDFLPREALGHASDVLTPGGKAIFHFHHPNMIPEDLTRVRNPRIKAFWTYLKERNVLFKSEVEIRASLKSVNLNVTEVAAQHDRYDTWWEVVARKERLYF